VRGGCYMIAVLKRIRFLIHHTSSDLHRTKPTHIYYMHLPVYKEANIPAVVVTLSAELAAVVDA
jgi:hypothetical protein